MIADLTVTEFGSGALLVLVLQQLKKWFPVLASAENWILTALSALWALVSTLLVSWEWSGTLHAGGTLTLVVPSLANLLVGVWHWFSQGAIQEVLYRVAVKPKETR